ncbi:MAG: sugar phosphate isomerase/epimerase [Phycisphaerae bacterium]|nr:sugar phosphate isomerase/epimerase [Phycisphaerae bacterium]
MPSMKRIGVITNGIDPDNTLAAIEAAKQMQMGYVDLRIVFGHVIETATPEEIHRIADACAAAELDVDIVYSSYGKCPVADMTSPKELDTLRAAMSAARALKAGRVRFFPGFYNPAVNEAEAAMKAVRQAVAIAEKEGVVLAMETETCNWSREPDFMKRCFDEITSDHLKILFDPSNLYLSGKDVIEAWNLMKRHTISIHVKDAAITARETWRNGGFIRGGGYNWVTLGDGEVPWKTLVEQIQRDGYEGNFGIELHFSPGAALVGVNLGRLKAFLGIKSPR